MPGRELSREELFALVWEKPTLEVAKELGISDVAVGKLCARLQVPKPPRGYWARVQAGQTPRRPPLQAFREEIERRRQEKARAKAAGVLSQLQQQFYRAALSDLRAHGTAIEAAELRGGKLPELDPDIAAQILLLIQNKAEIWVREGKVGSKWCQPVQSSAMSLVGKLLPVARPQMLMFDDEDRRSWRTNNKPIVLVRLTAFLQERIASLVRLVRDQQLHHVVMPLMAVDHAWSVHLLHYSGSRSFLDSTLCVSSTEIWVECSRKSWRKEDPPERMATERLRLQDVMPIDFMPVREISLPSAITRATAAPFRDRIDALLEAERVHELMSRATYAIEKEVPDDRLAIAEKIWFGSERPFQSARKAWKRLEEELDQWSTELDAERAALAKSVLGVEIGDIVTGQRDGRLLRISVTGVDCYAGDEYIAFIISGTRFRKDGTLGKMQESLSLHLPP